MTAPGGPPNSVQPSRRMTRLAVLLALASAWPREAQESVPVMGDRDHAFVAATPGYEFCSDFWTNVHQCLCGVAGDGPEEPDRTARDPAAPRPV